MYSIGLFSKMNRITTKTLRHYDEIGLLKPAHVDDFTGYRYYSSDQLVRLNQIIALKQMGIGLSDIGKILEHPEGVEVLLSIKENDLLKRIEEQKKNAKECSKLHEANKRRVDYEIYTSCSVPSRRYCGIHATYRSRLRLLL